MWIIDQDTVTCVGQSETHSRDIDHATHRPNHRPSAGVSPGPKMSSSGKRKLSPEKSQRGDGAAPEPKIYRLSFFLRDSFFDNSETFHRHEVLQVCVHGRNVRVPGT